MSLNSNYLQKYNKLIVEIGSGDGKLLYDLWCKDIHNNNCYIGLEKNTSLFEKSCLLVPNNRDNLLFINAPFEEVIDEFSENTIDSIILVLPPPIYIDQGNQEKWGPMYKTILSKIKQNGRFILITEYTDQLLSPVLPDDYIKWKNWLITTFIHLGFALTRETDGVPEGYSSQFIQKFKNDPERIKILTLILEKASKSP